jgi:hypothetical protein
MYINKDIQVALIRSWAFLRVCSQTLNERVEFYTGIYLLIIEYSFVSTNDSFNNWVTYELNFIDPSPNELTDNFASFISLSARQIKKWVSDEKKSGSKAGRAKDSARVTKNLGSVCF